MRKCQHQFFPHIVLSAFLFSLAILALFTTNIEATGETGARPTLTPDPRPTVESGEPKSDEVTRGAYIELHIEPGHLNYWSEVQWQDGLGDWHLVDGWRGSSTEGEVRWFLGEKDLGTGPFRWLVYFQENDDLLAVSESFYLPQKVNEIVIIYVQIDE